MRTTPLVLSATLLFSLACGLSPGVHTAAFTLDAKKHNVDSSFGYTTSDRFPVHQTSGDTTGTYLVYVRYRAGVSLKAGEKPDSGEGSFYVHNGRGELTYKVYVTKCMSVTKSDCLEKYVDPEVTISLVGYVQLTPLK